MLKVCIFELQCFVVVIIYWYLTQSLNISQKRSSEVSHFFDSKNQKKYGGFTLSGQANKIEKFFALPPCSPNS